MEKTQNKKKIQERSYDFSLRIIKLYKHIENDSVGKVVGKQLLQSGTSIGANVQEAYAGESRKDFIHKMTIAQKEAGETLYWLKLAKDSELTKPESMKEIIIESEEILKIISSIIVTAKNRMNS